MPNLNVTLSQPHVEDRMKKVLMVEETMDTHQTIISFSMVYRMILLSHVFCSLIISHTDCIRVTPGLYYSAAYIQIQIRVKEKKEGGHLKRHGEVWYKSVTFVQVSALKENPTKQAPLQLNFQISSSFFSL